jgi:hypothetical protein
MQFYLITGRENHLISNCIYMCVYIIYSVPVLARRVSQERVLEVQFEG